MPIPDEKAIVLQSGLLNYDDIESSCSGMIRYSPDGHGSYLRSEWQDAVDNICRCVSSGLLLVENDNFIAKYGSIAEALRTVSPFAPGDEKILWMGTFLSGTDKLHELVERWDTATPFQRGVLHRPFVDELEKIFADAGVPWTAEPLVPILENDH